MLDVIFLLIFLSIICKLLVSYIKAIRTGDPNESDLTYWMFSYDFKTKNKEWFPEEKNLLKRKRSRNTLVFILYINVFYLIRQQCILFHKKVFLFYYYFLVIINYHYSHC